ncbi:MAG: threonine synthase [Candidatus Limnocylindrales bacterium]
MPTQPTALASPELRVAGMAMPGVAVSEVEPRQRPDRPITDASASTIGSTVEGLRCKNCGRREAHGQVYVCGACFGPLEVAYDYAAIRSRLDRATIEARSPGIWRYQELLPVDAPPVRGLAVGSSPLVAADRLGAALGIDRLWLKDDTRNPTLSFKDRVVAVATAKALEFGATTIACASTGNLAGATAAAAAAAGLNAYVLVPADLERAKIDHALSYGATVVPIDGTYDQVNRLSMEVADELGWAFVNITLRPYYAEGSKTLAFEIAEQLGWRLPDVVVVPIASGSLFTKVAKGFDELVTVGLVEPKTVRFVGGQAAGCAPVATAYADGSDIIAPVERPDTIVRSLAIGSPADGRYALELARRTGGSIESIPDAETAVAIRSVAALEGLFPETAGGVTIAAAERARAAGVIGPDDEVVVLLTGNGLKTPDARMFGLDERSAVAGSPGLAPVIRPSLDAFERWLEA